MSTDKTQDLAWKEKLASIDRQLAEHDKLRSEESLNSKKAKWYELTLAIALFAAGAAWAKFFGG